MTTGVKTSYPKNTECGVQTPVIRTERLPGKDSHGEESLSKS